MKKTTGKVNERVPTQQGLKPGGDLRARGVARVNERVPTQQGLKPGFAPSIGGVVAQLTRGFQHNKD